MGPSRASSASTRAGRTRSMSMGSRGLTASAARRASPVAWLSVPRTARQKRRRSASSPSSESHATGPGARPAATHELSSAVFPAPAGAASSVSGPCTPASRESSSRPRDTIVIGPRGTENFVFSTVCSAGRFAARARGSGRSLIIVAPPPRPRSRRSPRRPHARPRGTLQDRRPRARPPSASGAPHACAEPRTGRPPLTMECARQCGGGCTPPLGLGASLARRRDTAAPPPRAG